MTDDELMAEMDQIDTQIGAGIEILEGLVGRSMAEDNVLSPDEAAMLWTRHHELMASLRANTELYLKRYSAMSERRRSEVRRAILTVRIRMKIGH